MSELFTYLQNHEAQFRRARLASLYSDFKQQHAHNPDGYASNITAWVTGLAHAMKAGVVPGGPDFLSLRTGEALLRALETKEWGKPLALDAVIDEAVTRGSMIPLSTFLTRPLNYGRHVWVPRPWSIISWTIRQFGFTDRISGTPSFPTEQFVVLENVKEAAGRVTGMIDEYTSRVDRLFPMKAFEEAITKVLDRSHGITNDDLHILIVYLARDTGVITFNEQLVKLRGPGEGLPEITAQDVNIVLLKRLIMDLTIQVDSLATKIGDSSEKARDFVTQKNRPAAIASLRRKKLQEDILARRSETLAQLEAAYAKIQEAADQVEIMRVMQASTQALKSLHTEIGTVETVEDMLAGLREQMDNVDDIGSIINEHGQRTAMVDETIVDEELELLEKQERNKKDEESVVETQKRLQLIDSPIPSSASKPEDGRRIHDPSRGITISSQSAISEEGLQDSMLPPDHTFIEQSAPPDMQKQYAVGDEQSKRIAIPES